MKHGVLMFEDEFRKLYTKAGQDCKINEIELFDTDNRILIFCINKIHYIPVNNVIDILEYFFGFKLDREINGFITSLVRIYRIGDLDEASENKDLEVCRAEDITNQVYQLVYENQKYSRSESEKNLFNEIEMGTMSKPNTVGNSDHLNKMYPFVTSWNDTAVDDILQNIYDGDYSEESQTKRYPGRGRCRVKQANLKERPFVCDYPDCKRAFKRFEHLKRHNKMHTGERPYKCKYPGCLKAFSRSDNLSQHFKIHNISSKGHSLNFRTYQYTNKDID